VTATQSLVESLKQLLAAANPGLATKDDVAQLEERVDELAQLVEELAAVVAANGRSERGAIEPGSGA
jgi:hypothetical protein